MPKVQIACEDCGKVFEHFPSKKRRFCSSSCRARFHLRQRMENGTYVQPRKPKTGKELACETCGVLVYRRSHQLRDIAAGKRVYCSKTCADIGYTRPRVKRECGHCGVEMELRPSELRQHYCSRRCRDLAQMKRPLDRTHNGKPARLDKNGYVMLWEPNHPDRTHGGWQYEHRLIAAAALGRVLLPTEAVHHINGVKDDNRPENLQVMDGGEHAALSSRDYRASVNAQLAELAEYRKRFGALDKEDQ